MQEPSDTIHPIINCHTHIFTGDHVPPFLAKTFLPWPVYLLLPLSMVVGLFRFWYKKIAPRLKGIDARKIHEKMYRIRMFIQRTGLIRIAVFIIGVVLTISTFLILFDLIAGIDHQVRDQSNLTRIRTWLSHNIPIAPASIPLRIAIVLTLFIFFKSGRNVILFLLKKLSSIVGALPGPKSKELAKRYLNIGRFAFHDTQKGTWEQLQAQYPPGSGFVVLPMDMEYMEAGSLKTGFEYFNQMEGLKKIKTNAAENKFFYPFVFLEPRRIADEKQPDHKKKKPVLGGKVQLEWTSDNGTVTLGDCFIGDYIEKHKFSGFKIYPALGYYPFDKELLALWKYAADNSIPILTHCIRGNIYFRGTKKKEWDKHPVFVQADGDEDFTHRLALMEIKNSDFINNFTHPMNYLCLLEETLLRKVVGSCADPKIQGLFGYKNLDTPLLYNLSHLKLCLGHFGGDDEWNRYMELDRDQYTRQLVKDPVKGIPFFTNNEGEPRKGKPEQLWKNTDWYSIICSIMLQFDHVYADLSYIVHNQDIHPLLKQTLLNPKLKRRTLFGTDFYVVRNHNSEKSLLANTIDHLSKEDFDQIARINPREFLWNKLHGPVMI